MTDSLRDVPPKPEVEITLEQKNTVTRFQLLAPHICDHARLRYDSVDTVQRRPTTDSQGGGHRNRKW